MLQHQIVWKVFFTLTKTRSASQWLLEKPGHVGVRIEATPRWHFKQSKKMAFNYSVLSDASSALRLLIICLEFLEDNKDSACPLALCLCSHDRALLLHNLHTVSGENGTESQITFLCWDLQPHWGEFAISIRLEFHFYILTVLFFVFFYT